MAGKQKNFQINDLLLAQLKQFEADSAKKGIRLTGAQVVNGALLQFFGLPMEERYELIRRGRNIDLDNADADAAQELAEGAGKTRPAAETSASGKGGHPKRRQTS